jgi:gliding motility-associated-like protein
VGDCTSSPDSEVAQVTDLGSFSISSNASGPLCAGQNALLSVNNVSGHTYQWIRNGADIAGQVANTFTATLDGVYKVRVTFSGCSRETSDANVIILSKPVAGFNVANAACLAETLDFTNTSTVDNRAIVIYNWDFDDGQTSSSENVTHTYLVTGSLSPTLTVSYSGVASCTGSLAKSTSISDATLPQITADVTEICPGDNAMLSIEGTYTTITWNTNEASAFIIVNEPNTYNVITEDGNGCIGTDEITIGLRSGCGEIDIEIPKMFSPNNDTRNDRWVIEGIENYSECTMKIFDDKGVGIFQETGYPLEGWDGSHKNGRAMPDGVYYYILACPDRTPVTGSVTILR